MHRVAAGVALGLFLSASTALADEEPSPSARVVSHESAETLARTACDLTAVASIGGHALLFDIYVDGKRCSSLPAQDDALVLRVSIEPRADGQHDVVFEADVPEGVASKDVLRAVDTAAREMLGRIDGPQRDTVVPNPVDSRPAPSSGTRGGGIALMAVGGAGFGIAAVVGVVALVDSAGHAFGCGVSYVFGSSCGNQDLSGYGIAAGIAAGIGTVFMITGGILLSQSSKSSVSAQIGPTGGSLRVTF